MSGNLVVSTINGVDISVSPVATQAYASAQDLGVGQTWKVRVLTSNTTYTNTSGKVKFINFYVQPGYGNYASCYVDGVLAGTFYGGFSGYGVNTGVMSIIVPNGSTFSCTYISSVAELS